jgi:segregation and condensation protein B
MVESGGGWQFLTKKEYYKTIAQLYGDKFLKKLSVAAIETLSIIAYKQPVTKSEIELIRGVNCDYAVQKLLEKELIVISGRKEDAVGKPLIYATSKSFMDYFGINSANDLPKIKEILDQEIIEATRIEREEEMENIPEEFIDHIESKTMESEFFDGEEIIKAVIIEEEMTEVHTSDFVEKENIADDGNDAGENDQA